MRGGFILGGGDSEVLRVMHEFPINNPRPCVAGVEGISKCLDPGIGLGFTVSTLGPRSTQHRTFEA